MVGFLDIQSAANITEAIYIAYFGRAADGPGDLYWNLSYGVEIPNGIPSVTAATNIANSFAEQNEAKAIYSFLASPPPLLNPNDPVQIAAANGLIETAYQTLFSRAADSAGLAYWVGQILSGAFSVGAAIYAIADGAQTTDQAILTDKIVAATVFTTGTYAANLGTSTPLSSDFVTAAENSVGPVNSGPSLTASEVASAAYATGTAASTTTTTITVTGPAGSNLTIGDISDSALTKFDAHADAGFMSLTIAQPGLTILGATGGDTIVANSATDTIIVGSATTGLIGNVNITANGGGDTFLLVHSTGVATTNTIGAASGGDTFTVNGGTNTIGGTIAGGVYTHALGNNNTITLLSGATSGAGISANDSVWAGGGVTTVSLGSSTAAFGAGAHADTAVVNVTGDLTGATALGSPAMVVIAGASTLGANGTLQIDFHNSNVNNTTLASETWAGGSASDARLNVAAVTTLAAAWDLAAAASPIIDNIQSGATNTQVVNGVLLQDGNTGLIVWFQFGGNTYIVDAINNNPTNSSSTAVAHTALTTTDELVELTGLVNLASNTHVSIIHV